MIHTGFFKKTDHEVVSRVEFLKPCPETLYNTVGLCCGFLISYTSSAVAPIFEFESSGRVEGGPRSMKTMRPPLAGLVFMTYFYNAGGIAPSPPESATVRLQTTHQ